MNKFYVLLLALMTILASNVINGSGPATRTATQKATQYATGYWRKFTPMFRQRITGAANRFKEWLQPRALVQEGPAQSRIAQEIAQATAAKQASRFFMTPKFPACLIGGAAAGRLYQKGKFEGASSFLKQSLFPLASAEGYKTEKQAQASLSDAQRQLKEGYIKLFDYGGLSLEMVSRNDILALLRKNLDAYSPDMLLTIALDPVFPYMMFRDNFERRALDGTLVSVDTAKLYEDIVPRLEKAQDWDYDTFKKLKNNYDKIVDELRLSKSHKEEIERLFHNLRDKHGYRFTGPWYLHKARAARSSSVISESSGLSRSQLFPWTSSRNPEKTIGQIKKIETDRFEIYETQSMQRSYAKNKQTDGIRVFEMLQSGGDIYLIGVMRSDIEFNFIKDRYQKQEQKQKQEQENYYYLWPLVKALRGQTAQKGI